MRLTGILSLFMCGKRIDLELPSRTVEIEPEINIISKNITTILNEKNVTPIEKHASLAKPAMVLYIPISVYCFHPSLASSLLIVNKSS